MKTYFDVHFIFSKLRLTVYRVLALWCSTLKEGSHCEIISEAVIKEIINDLLPRPENCSLAVTIFLIKKAIQF